MPSVFVLMPFDEEFTPVYSDVIKHVLEQEGFEVLRADDIQSQRNIMRDIIEMIAKSDLIIADLTSSNPNVYYELGIAHALEKPVIHLVQSPVEDVPFDLRSYRLITYSTHFTEIGKARGELAEYARKFLEGKLPVGNPVTDFYPGGDSANPPADAKSNDTFDADRESDEKYELVQLGENGHFVQRSIADPELYICPVCYAKDKIEIPIQRDRNNDYLCNSCETPFRTNPDWRPPARVRSLR